MNATSLILNNAHHTISSMVTPTDGAIFTNKWRECFSLYFMCARQQTRTVLKHPTLLKSAKINKCAPALQDEVKYFYLFSTSMHIGEGSSQTNTDTSGRQAAAG